MEQLLPSALVIGVDHFVAGKLVEELVKKDITVIGVGEDILGLKEFKNFELVDNLDRVEGQFNYVFDFRGNNENWKKLDFKKSKISVICVDNEKKAKGLKEKLKDEEGNWRLIEAWGVYGVGMGNDWFLPRALELAVRNNNLELPEIGVKYRLLAVEDLVEAILRASFLSGTERETFLVLGKEVDSEEVAKVLIDEAKMTRLKVLQKKIDIFQGDLEKADETQKKLRWEAKISFNKGVKEVLQYFFTKMDEEGRNRGKKPERKEKIDVDEMIIKRPRERERNFEVVVDEDQEIVGEEIVEDESEEFVDIPKFDLKKNKNWLKKEPEETVLEIEEDEDIEDDKEEAVEKVKMEMEKEKIESKKIIKKRRGLKIWGFLLVLLVIGVSIVPFDWILSTYFTVKNIQKVPVLVKEGKYIQAEGLVNKNLVKIQDIDEKINEWGLNKLKSIRNYQSSLKVVGDLLEIEQKGVALARSADLINGAIFNDKEIDWIGEMSSLKEKLVDLEGKVGILQARLNGDTNWLPTKWKLIMQDQMKNLTEIKKEVGLGVKATEMLPGILGLDGKERNYLVLFQNESELRPTGGFIGSYGILSFKNGKLLSLDIRDVYEADGQLDGHVEPPWELKTYLNQANWYMRDANWNVNFPTAAVDLQWFLSKETGKKVDGVIGIDLAVAKAMVGVVGEIYVPDFKETITKDNLYDQAEFYTETKFFPGSNQKASFLGSLGRQLFDGIGNLSSDKKLELLKTTLSLLEKNEIQLAFNDKDLANISTSLGWDGSVYSGKCETENCISDYLYIVEANLGVNKANYFLNRSIEEVVDIGEKNLGRVLKINYENTAKNATWPGGDYKNYLRIYLPLDAEILQVMVIDGNDPAAKKIYISDEIREREVNGKKEIGFLVTVPVTKKRIVEVDYSSSINLSDKSKFSYANYIQKQPGTGETNMVSLLSFPDGWQPTQVQPMASAVGGKLLFNQNLNEDVKIGVQFEK